MRPPRKGPPKKVLEEQSGRWWHQMWTDGTEQWSIFKPGVLAWFYVERVKRPKSRRKYWCVVNRKGPTPEPGRLQEMDTSMYPPKVAGPFPQLAGAKAALLVLLSGEP